MRVIIIASLLGLAACGGSPLDGTWDGPSATTLGTTYHAEVALNGDGTLTYSLIGSGACNGTQLYTGYTWASDNVTLTFSGTPTCTGSINCGAISFNCQQAQQSTLGACDYVLTNSNDTLTTTNCSNSSLDTTWTRAK